MPSMKLLASQFAACRAAAGIWSAALAFIEGRSARLFERERRQTYEAVPRALQPGTCLYDRRADGSILEIRIPPAARPTVSLDTGKQETAGKSAVMQARDIVDNHALEAPARSQKWVR